MQGGQRETVQEGSQPLANRMKDTKTPKQQRAQVLPKKGEERGNQEKVCGPLSLRYLAQHPAYKSITEGKPLEQGPALPGRAFVPQAGSSQKPQRSDPKMRDWE